MVLKMGATTAPGNPRRGTRRSRLGCHRVSMKHIAAFGCVSLLCVVVCAPTALRTYCAEDPPPLRSTFATGGVSLWCSLLVAIIRVEALLCGRSGSRSSRQRPTARYGGGAGQVRWQALYERRRFAPAPVQPAPRTGTHIAAPATCDMDEMRIHCAPCEPCLCLRSDAGMLAPSLCTASLPLCRHATTRRASTLCGQRKPQMRASTRPGRPT